MFIDPDDGIPPPDGGCRPAAEACNGVDDDCDGMTDEDFPALGEMCTIGMGLCEATGAVICTPDGGGTVCGAEGAASVGELCNGLDDDCDGAVDEGFDVGGRCVAGRGACEAVGVRICDAGGGARCDAMVGEPQPELCNGLDDDCDGRVDEAIPPRTVTFFRTGEACCDMHQDDGVSAGEPPRDGPWFDVAEREVVDVRVRHASDGQAGCTPCADCPDDCNAHDAALCDDPDPQGNERLRVDLLAEGGPTRHLGDTEDVNGGGGGDWRAAAQQCRQHDHRFPSVEPGPGRYRVRVQHVNDDGPSNSTKLQTSRAIIRCGP